MARVVVIGAGVIGLAAAYQALLDGHEVDILEGASEPGAWLRTSILAIFHYYLGPCRHR